MPGMRGRARLLAPALIAALGGCGGGSSPSAPSSPPPPQRTLIAQATQGGIAPSSGGVAYFLVVNVSAVTTNAVLEATVDWTSASNQIALVWAQGDCTTDPNCSPIAQNTSPAKPKTVTTPLLAAGNYTLAIVNLGTTEESVTYQIFIIH